MASAKKALLVGNDINNIVPGYAWGDLLDELIEFVGAKGRITRMNGQFPLFYEEIWAHAGKANRSELEIKQFIAEKIKAIEPNGIHHGLVELGCTDILTTNYDYSLERALREPLGALKNEGVVTERDYSLFRHHTLADKRFWHLHGDQAHPASIALGYEHYAGYLQGMRNYVVSGVKYKDRNFDSLLQRMKTGPLEQRSWLDVFFSRDVHVVGLGLDFVEIHLWWLLTYLARNRRQPKQRVKYTHRVHYYLPSFLETEAADRLRLLKALGVNVVSVKARANGRRAYYQEVIKRIAAA